MSRIQLLERRILDRDGNWIIITPGGRTIKLRKFQRGILQMMGGGTMGGACQPGSSVIPDQSEIVCSPTDAWVGAKWDTDGEIYFYEANSQGFGAGSGQFWIGNCPNTGYDGRWTQISGDSPDVTSQAVNVWTSMNTDLSLENRALGISSVTDGVYQFQLRTAVGQQTILTDEFRLEAETEDPMPK